MTDRSNEAVYSRQGGNGGCCERDLCPGRGDGRIQPGSDDRRTAINIFIQYFSICLLNGF